MLALLYLAAFAVSISATVMFALYTGFGGTCCCLPVFILPLVVLIYAVYDAYEVAEKINLGQPAKDWL